ncbi:YggT family protein [Alloscardovia omnicolens]|uniref:YggT family protein n=1 Tax=Alloscardovia omnicolens TaxID=419015 RepID=UPI0006684B33|nr:YggT family protein [Alloscardovia omnicolens]MDK6327774.1 YggT family protein [Alloscardovia omnicolens]MDK6521657.1 YggT family protein [Alloscardovia omnicolens]MDK8073764.1 YggT family protein [Alloscardovia omnicolens]MDK8080703.1 YggT family protein [Alloscardovia omnicolens]
MLLGIALARIVLSVLLEAYMSILFIRLVLDWVAVLTRWKPRGFIYTLINAVYVVTDPPLNYLRRFIKPLPMGPMYLDLSFIVLWFGLGLVRMFI